MNGQQTKQAAIVLSLGSYWNFNYACLSSSGCPLISFPASWLSGLRWESLWQELLCTHPQNVQSAFGTAPHVLVKSSVGKCAIATLSSHVICIWDSILHHSEDEFREFQSQQEWRAKTKVSRQFYPISMCPWLLRNSLGYQCYVYVPTRVASTALALITHWCYGLAGELFLIATVYLRPTLLSFFQSRQRLRIITLQR